MKIKLLLLFMITAIGCNTSTEQINPKIIIYDDAILSIIDNTATIDTLAYEIGLPEGPVWDEKSNSLLFVDLLANKVLKWNEKEGVSDFITPSGNTGYAPNYEEGGILGANGLGIDADGNLILCQHGDRRLAVATNNSSTAPVYETLADRFEGKRLNSPNDLTFSKNGDIYFTDPPFGFFNLQTFKVVESELREIGFSGVYKLDTDNKLSLISNKVNVPNGIALSTDEKFLYVNKMGMFDGNPNILKFDLESLENEVLFDGKEISSKYEGNFDGMKVHSSGNIFTSGPGGILIISAEGKLMARIDFGHVTNCTFDENEEYLYITGFVNNPKVYRIKLM
jgi:gluconolactonase